jgi:prolyl-tRNA synthetase
MGTSHWLSQDFAKVAEMKFQDREGNLAYPHLTSWGATTRLVGAVIMVHGDEVGLVLPPKVAPIQVIIIPILKKDSDNSAVQAQGEHIKEVLKKAGIRAVVDADDSKTPGAKFYHWELKGVPVRLEIGPRDLEKRVVIATDRLGMGKKELAFDAIDLSIIDLLSTIQQEMFKRALARRNAMWFKEAKLATFGPQLDTNPGFYQTGWCGNAICEAEIKVYKGTTRCVLAEKTFPECFHCSQPNKHDVLIAKAY